MIPPATVQLADAVDWLAALQPGSVDLLVTDLAYESLEKHRNPKARIPRLCKRWFPIFPNHRIPTLMHYLFRAMKPSSHGYLFCDDETSDLLKPAARDAGFIVWKRLIWNKDEIGMGYHWRNSAEFILFIEKRPQKQLVSKKLGDVRTHRKVRNGYPTEKPVALCQELIENSSATGDLVADPFCGSGAVGVAALRSGRRFAGADVLQEAIDLTRHRLIREVAGWAGKASGVGCQT